MTRKYPYKHPLGVACPTCRVIKGNKCQPASRRTGAPRIDVYHSTRIALAEVAVGCPSCKALPDGPCINTNRVVIINRLHARRRRAGGFNRPGRILRDGKKRLRKRRNSVVT